MSRLGEIIDQLRQERAVIDDAIAALEKLAGSIVVTAPAAAAAQARERKPRSGERKAPSREPKRPAGETKGGARETPKAYDPTIKGREIYAEVLRKLEKPRAREDLLKGAPPQRSKALNAMERHGLIEDNDGFVRITEAGELYLLEANQ